jgi:hypothetical protein
MHTHIIINHDEGLHLTLYTEVEDPDLSEIIEEIIIENLNYA